MKNHDIFTEPGTKEFKSLLKDSHIIIAEELDRKVRTGIHEPGHGAAHMEMTLYYFRELADLLNLPQEQKDIVSLAAILHDIWREDIDHSHTIKSAELARILMDTHELFNKKYKLSKEIKDIVEKFILLHSNKSARKRKISVPPEMIIALIALQTGDMIAQAGPFGYLRSFSYSGHVLRERLSRIKHMIKDPKRFQDKIPKNLKKFLFISDNFFHIWVLSIMSRTNTNYAKTMKDDKVREIAEKWLTRGVTTNLMTDLIHVDYKKDNKTSTNDNEKAIEHNTHKIIEETIDLLDQSRLYYEYFTKFIDQLDIFSMHGIINEDKVDKNIEHDILKLLEYSIPGICSRAFWGQFNPIDDNDEESSDEYLTLPNRIFNFSKMLKGIEGIPENAGIITDEGKVLFGDVFDNTLSLVSSAIHQYKTQRWTVEMWDQ